ncbi:wnt inhibitory factor 1 isoform X5 [Rhipicephalus sanguineus]|uniref:wnt inhibitory factor 1 isoform X5 n=1 Tax=Rhipicephalus sanguineus TaxID=34632 RepID=UPI0020C5249A|nr:wnt inhibitory factor 1 isoform X5 [Rhipicephalus sanguineus]
MALLVLVLLLAAAADAGRAKPRNDDFSLWIDEKQVREFSGFPMEIFAILDGVVLPYILDPNFERYLPVIPSGVHSVNFTWKAGENKHYYYDFDVLESFDSSILKDPVISIETKGKVPRKAKGPDPECDRKCANGGRCNAEKICECPKRYMGRYCRTAALCYPQCMNGGTCVAPGVCDCAVGYQGPHCEGGICAEKCLNGGKCVQKDTCSCRRGHYGPRCEYSKCSIPCLNGGRCVGVNQCRCTRSFVGPQCAHRVDATAAVQREHCQRRCVHGVCIRHNRCLCDEGFFGRRCARRIPRRKERRKKQFV